MVNSLLVFFDHCFTVGAAPDPALSPVRLFLILECPHYIRKGGSWLRDTPRGLRLQIQKSDPESGSLTQCAESEDPKCVLSVAEWGREG